jgi:hypothetical protein
VTAAQSIEAAIASGARVRAPSRRAPNPELPITLSSFGGPADIARAGAISLTCAFRLVAAVQRTRENASERDRIGTPLVGYQRLPAIRGTLFFASYPHCSLFRRSAHALV